MSQIPLLAKVSDVLLKFRVVYLPANDQIDFDWQVKLTDFRFDGKEIGKGNIWPLKSQISIGGTAEITKPGSSVTPFCRKRAQNTQKVFLCRTKFHASEFR